MAGGVAWLVVWVGCVVGEEAQKCLDGTKPVKNGVWDLPPSATCYHPHACCYRTRPVLLNEDDGVVYGCKEEEFCADASFNASHPEAYVARCQNTTAADGTPNLSVTCECRGTVDCNARFARELGGLDEEVKEEEEEDNDNHALHPLPSFLLPALLFAFFLLF